MGGFPELNTYMDADSCDSASDDDAGASGDEFSAYPKNQPPKSAGPGREASSGNDDAPRSSDEDSESEDVDEEKPPEHGSQDRGPVPLAADVLVDGSVVCVAVVDTELWDPDSIHGAVASIGYVVGGLEYRDGKFSPVDLSDTQATHTKLHNIRRPPGTQALAACSKIHGLTEADSEAAATFPVVMRMVVDDIVGCVKVLSRSHNVTAVVLAAHNGWLHMHAM